VTLLNYLSSPLNPAQTVLIATLGTLLFGALTAYPIEFWRKTPYTFANIMAVYIFHSMLKCPKEGEGQGYGLEDSSQMIGLPINGWIEACIILYLVFQYFEIYVIANLLGRRTGHTMSLILRTFVYIGVTA
jgi:hypothetical protein